MNRMDKEITILVGMIVAFIVVVLTLTFVSAGVRADLWNRCHPEFQVTHSESWWAGSTLMIDGCDND